MTEEQLTRKISKTLNGLCPSFSRDKDGGPAEWHKCNCKATGNSCACVWHITDTCVARKWKKLSFVKKHNSETKIERNKALIKAIEVANNSNNNEASVEDRFEILDL